MTKTLDDIKSEVCNRLAEQYRLNGDLSENGKGYVLDVIDHLHSQGLLMVWNTDMDSAPKHQYILTRMKHGIIEGRWDGEIAYGYYWRDIEWCPTAWMPLPKYEVTK